MDSRDRKHQVGVSVYEQTKKKSRPYEKECERSSLERILVEVKEEFMVFVHKYRFIQA